MAAKKLLEAVADDLDKKQTYNPLLVFLKENDKKNLFDVINVSKSTTFN